MWSALALGASYAVGIGLAPDPAGSPAPASFQWEAPEPCPTAATVQAAVEHHLGAPLHGLDISPWSVLGTITPDPDGGWSLDLVVVTPDGLHDRPLHDPSDCAVVSDTAALLIALALDPEAVASTSAGEVAGESKETVPDVSDGSLDADSTREGDRPALPPPPLRAPAEPMPPPSEPEPVGRPQSVRAGLGVNAGVDWGSLRGAAPTGQLYLAVLLRRARIGAHTTLGSSPRFKIPGTESEGTVWSWAVGLEAGPVLRARKFEFPLLAGIEAGQLAVWPRALLDPKRQRVTWAALTVLPGVAWVPLPWFAVVFRAGAMVALTRPSFEVRGLGEIHRPAPAGFRASLSLEARFQ